MAFDTTASAPYHIEFASDGPGERAKGSKFKSKEHITQGGTGGYDLSINILRDVLPPIPNWLKLRVPIEMKGII